MDNLKVAYNRAHKGKAKQKGVIEFDKNIDENLLVIYNELKDKIYRTSEYKYFIIYDPKERKIASLPFKDRIVHHLIMMPLENILLPVLTSNTFSCIKGRGIHKAKEAVTKYLKRQFESKYCLKIDVKQFYPTIDHDILKTLLRKKIKDNDFIDLLDGIIDSYSQGVPIGNFISQWFANFYLCYLDHVIKETFGVKRYCRYADDMIIIDSDIQYLHSIRVLIQEYLWCELKLDMKDNYQVFPVSETNGRAIDFVGYPQYHTHIRLRKKIKQRFARMLARRKNKASIASYGGWIKHCDGINLKRTLLHE